MNTTIEATTTAGTNRILLKNILLATDLSECANQALPYALSMARRHKATVHAACVVPNNSTAYYLSPADWAMLTAAEEKQVRGYAATLEKQLGEVSHHVMTPSGNVADALLQAIAKHEIDLLVMGTHGRSGVRKLLMGSVAENVFRRAQCPVLTVGPNVPAAIERETKFHCILFATDFSQGSLAALPHAISVAEEDEARLILLHVVNQPVSGIVNLDADTEFLLRRLRSLIPFDAVHHCQPECVVEFGESFDSPARRIIEIAEDKQADLLVLGVRRAHGELGLVSHLSSTIARVLTQATCPVLTVRG
jgi:nucleotide-binding universal stress UspA family protein